MRRRLWRSFSSQWTKMAMAPSPKRSMIVLIFVQDRSHICSRSFSCLSKIVLIFVQDRSHVCSRLFSCLFKIVLIFVQDRSHICSRSFSYLSKIVLIFTPKASRAALVQKYSLTWRKNCCQSSPTNCQCFTKSSTS